MHISLIVSALPDEHARFSRDEDVQDVLRLVRHLEGEALPGHAVPGRAELLIHALLNELGSRACQFTEKPKASETEGKQARKRTKQNKVSQGRVGGAQFSPSAPWRAMAAGRERRSERQTA